ncbi:MAG: hypothetical protein M1823_008328, partial [Watsoniomyces obsoletus]
LPTTLRTPIIWIKEWMISLSFAVGVAAAGYCSMANPVSGRKMLFSPVRRGMREQAQRVDEGMMGLGEAMEKAKEEIWAERAERLGGENRVEAWEAERRPRGADGVFWESQQQQVDEEGQGREDVPEVKAWKGGEIFAH